MDREARWHEHTIQGGLHLMAFSQMFLSEATMSKTPYSAYNLIQNPGDHS